MFGSDQRRIPERQQETLGELQKAARGHWEPELQKGWWGSWELPRAVTLGPEPQALKA